mmetsp:Transcript_33548/g.61503  ORF Transcript_33548/g.61503 Transcript_33548/m.61503 type:complete len:658 (+) Transcript_33548:184-2157(+)
MELLSFVRGLVGQDLQPAASLLSLAEDDVGVDGVVGAVAAAIDAEKEPDPSLCLGSGATAKVVANFAKLSGADARTLRTLVDVLLLADPAPDPPQLWLCLEALIRRFAPVARLPESGDHLMEICQLFESLILFHDPELAIVLKRAGVGSETYCIPWLLTAHAVGLAEQSAVLHIWKQWCEGGEALDPIFFGLARVHICREELLLCGPVPELAQLLQTSLSGKQHASVAVLNAALERAADFKAVTPLSFLKRLQDVLLRPKGGQKPNKAVELAATSSTRTEEDENSTETSPVHQGTSSSKGLGFGQFAARAGNLLRRGASKTDATASKPARKPITCMRVEAQDVMMFETVRERHMERVLQMEQASSNGSQGDNTSGTGIDSIGMDALSRRSRSQADTTCRLVPRLIDLRPPLEVARLGVKSCYCVDVSRKKTSVMEFVQWATKRAGDMEPYQLQPMHVLMTSAGGLSPDQQLFLEEVLNLGVKGVCILLDGYSSLEPFFVDDNPPSQGGATEERATAMLQKGMAGVASLSQSLWARKSAAIALKEQVMERMTSKSSASIDASGEASGVQDAEEPEEAPTFERESAPPVPPECILPPATAGQPVERDVAHPSTEATRNEAAAAEEQNSHNTTGGNETAPEQHVVDASEARADGVEDAEG